MVPLDAVTASELCAGLTEERSRRLAALATERQLAAGQVLFRLGDEADTLFLVRSGHVELTFPLLVMGEPRDVRFQSLEPGRVLAWSALVPPHKATMSARSTVETELCALARADLLRLFAEEPGLGLAVTANLAHVVAARLLEAHALWARELQRSLPQTYR